MVIINTKYNQSELFLPEEAAAEFHLHVKGTDSIPAGGPSTSDKFSSTVPDLNLDMCASFTREVCCCSLC